LAAVDATDWAIDGTVSCANREEGRPDFTGTALVAGAGAGTGGEGAIACTDGLTFASTETGGVLAEMDLEIGFTARALAVGAFTLVALSGTATGAADFFAATDVLRTVAVAVLAAWVTGWVCVAFSPALGLAFFADFTALSGLGGISMALLTGFIVTLALVGGALVVLAFTFCLLTETRGVLLRGVWLPVSGAAAPGPTARECTGIPKGKPIICNSVTNMSCLRKNVFEVRVLENCCAAQKTAIVAEL